MKKILYCFLIVATVLTIVSCGDKELTSINPGLYEVEFNLNYGSQVLVAKQRVRYSSDGTYEATNLNNNSAIEELKGKFKIENKELVSYDNYSRSIIKNGTWTKQEPSKVEIRRIKNRSYQYYFKFPNDRMRVLYKQVGLSEGWKTYIRISD